VRCETNRPAGAFERDCQACARNLSVALRNQQFVWAGNCRCLSQVSGAFCANVFVLKDTGCTHWTVLADGPRQPFRFAAHRQPLCWNFLYQSCIVLSVGGSVCLPGTSQWLNFGKFQDTECFLIPCPHHVSSQLPPSSEACKYATAPITQTNLERLCTYWYAPFCCVCHGCCAAKFRNSRGTYELLCTYIYIYQACWFHLLAFSYLLTSIIQSRGFESPSTAALMTGF
jgi:hypothetical protein